MAVTLSGATIANSRVQAAPLDRFWPNVSLLLPGSGTNGAQNNTFLDSSANAFAITRNGNTTQGTFSPYGPNWSNFFDGNGDFLTAPDNAALNMGTSDFTLEAWIYLTATPGVASPGGAMIINKDGQNGVSWAQYHLAVTSGLKAVFGASAVPNAGAAPTAVITGATTLALNTWYHVAVTRIGANATLWVNGVSDGTTASVPANLTNGARPLYSGYENGQPATYYFPGYISNARVVKGTAVYTTNFTPPTAPLTAITNTSLLTCQSNRLIDNSGNNFTITRNGDVSVQRFSPFSPAAAYDSAVIGGSAYSDGGADYLSVPDNTALNLGSSNFTIEFWYYNIAASNDTNIVAKLSATDGFHFFAQGSPINSYRFRVVSGGVQQFNIVTSGTVTTNGWMHIAVTRNGSSWNIWMNGVSSASATSSVTIPTVTDAMLLLGNTTRSLSGFISNLRIVKGTAVYTSAFTPPTAPLTDITNTSLLLNFTNAGIIDNAMMNDMETVGTAQLSNAQAKWGSTSISFDGTGDWLVMPNAPPQQLGTGNFTIEGWLYLNATGVAYGVISKGTATTGWSVNVTSGNKLQFSYTATQLTGATSLVSGQWYHFAVVRNGTGTGNLLLYLNGVADATSAGAVTDNFNQTNVQYVGADRVGGSSLNGYVQDARVTNGVARYTANFTPPPAAFPLS